MISGRRGNTRARSVFADREGRTAEAALLCFALATAACVHRPLMPPPPAVTLSDLRVAQGIDAGQILYEGVDGRLVPGPELRSMGLLIHTRSIGTLQVRQPDITLGELVNVVGGSADACAPPQAASKETDPLAWLHAEHSSIVGDDVTLILTGVTDAAVDKKSLEELFEEELRRNRSDVPWSGISRAKAPLEKVLIATEMISAPTTTLRFKIRENAALNQTMARFNMSREGMSAVLAKIAGACASNVNARTLVNGRIELTANRSTPGPAGYRLAAFEGPNIVAYTDLQTKLRLYSGARLPSPSHDKRRDALTPQQMHGIWSKNPGVILSFLNDEKDHPDEGATFFSYCPEASCKALITQPREFKENGTPYPPGPPDGCLMSRDVGSSWIKRAFSRISVRDARLRELVVFFSSTELPLNFAPALPNVPDFDSYSTVNPFTSHWIRSVTPSSVPSAIDKQSQPGVIWIYEYECRGGSPTMRADPPLTHLFVVGHLKEWGLDQDHVH